MSLGRVQAKQVTMDKTAEENSDSDIVFKDSDEHVWVDLTEVKTNGKVTLALLDGAEYTFDQPEILVGMEFPELLINLDEKNVSSVELPDQE